MQLTASGLSAGLRSPLILFEGRAVGARELNRERIECPAPLALSLSKGERQRWQSLTMSGV